MAEESEKPGEEEASSGAEAHFLHVEMSALNVRPAKERRDPTSLPFKAQGKQDGRARTTKEKRTAALKLKSDGPKKYP